MVVMLNGIHANPNRLFINNRGKVGSILSKLGSIDLPIDTPFLTHLRNLKDRCLNLGVRDFQGLLLVEEDNRG